MVQQVHDFAQFFECALRQSPADAPVRPHPWQLQLAQDIRPSNRLIRVPTGLGKTAGVVLAWLWNRVMAQNPDWPRRLVFCLPMRVLVEQTRNEVQEWLRRLDLLWEPETERANQVAVHLLLGGSGRTDWHLDVEHPAILIGTQDMLLSRALNRGYAASRARWPMELGLLSQDALWILDEVQLMDVGLTTSAQLQQFRDDDQARGSSIRPSYSWWMSATLQPKWLKSADTGALMAGLENAVIHIPEALRQGPLWEVTKSLSVVEVATPKDIAQQTWNAHATLQDGPYGRVTLLVVNTVDRALACSEELTKLAKGSSVSLKLVHSRFRGAERNRWVEEFLKKDACTAGVNRILVATQVVEAGVDISAGCLVTELAPWPSLVQRFGRAARYGGSAKVMVVTLGHKDARQAAPYALEALSAALELGCSRLTDVSQRVLEAFEAGLNDADRARLYPYAPSFVLLKKEWQELFDTTPDLTGADIDVSRFIRSGDERDVLVFWRALGELEPSKELTPGRVELCPVPFLRAQEWLCGKDGNTLLKGKQAWVWDFLQGAWRKLRRSDIVPGKVLLVEATSGGYCPERGFGPTHTSVVDAMAPEAVKRLPPPDPDAPKAPPKNKGASESDLASEHSQSDDPHSVRAFKTLATHCTEAASAAEALSQALALEGSLGEALTLAARWHDLGKAHPAFQGSIRHPDRPDRHDLAKAPDPAWSVKTRSHYYASSRPWAVPGEGASPQTRAAPVEEHRPGFRHELASMLGLFAVLLKHQPDHPALLGELHALLAELDRLDPKADVDSKGTGMRTTSASSAPTPTPSPTPLEQALLALDADAFDLVAYLVASHHGKVRMSLHATPDDQDYVDRDRRGLPIRGVREGDRLPSIAFERGAQLPALELTLAPALVGVSPRTGRSWSERTQQLLERLGPGTLAYLEACLRTADIRASKLETADPNLLDEETV